MRSGRSVPFPPSFVSWLQRPRGYRRTPKAHTCESVLVGSCGPIEAGLVVSHPHSRKSLRLHRASPSRHRPCLRRSPTERVHRGNARASSVGFGSGREGAASSPVCQLGLTGDCICSHLLTQVADAPDRVEPHPEMRLGPASVEAMRLAAQQAHNREDALLRVEDLLLGILETRCAAADILHATGMRSDVVRAQIAQLSLGTRRETDSAEQ